MTTSMASSGAALLRHGTSPAVSIAWSPPMLLRSLGVAWMLRRSLGVCAVTSVALIMSWLLSTTSWLVSGRRASGLDTMMHVRT